MKITTRQELADYCLRRLGSEVIEINVTDEQVADRIEDAIEMWQQYHYDGSERMYIPAKVVASTLTLSTPDASSFIEKEIVTGETSGATAEVYKVRDDNTTIELKRTVGTFANGEVITGSESGSAFTLAATNAFVLGNWDKQYFDIPDNVLSVVRVFPIGQTAANGSSRSVFDVIFQLRANETLGFMQSDMIYYTQWKQYLSMLDMLLPSERSFRFNRRTERLYLDMSWYDTLVPDMMILAEAHVVTDPEEFMSAYNDMFIKRYATALIKRQWGSNLSKFEGVQLPGGVTLNGGKIYQEAVEEIAKIEDEIRIMWEVPAQFFVG